MSNVTLLVVIILVVVVVAAAAVAAFLAARKRQTEKLREQFGPEYQRAVSESDDPRRAESELKERRKRHRELDLRDLRPDERDEFRHRWSEIQQEFVDDPGHAVRDADRLVVDVMSARGYPVDDFDQRADDLSVKYPVVTQRYREARKISRSNKDGTAGTEDLRQAVTSYRSLIDALLENGDDRPDDGRHREDRHREDRDRDDDRRTEDRPRGDRHRDERNGHRDRDRDHTTTGESPRTTDRETQA